MPFNPTYALVAVAFIIIAALVSDAVSTITKSLTHMKFSIEFPRRIDLQLKKDDAKESAESAAKEDTQEG